MLITYDFFLILVCMNFNEQKNENNLLKKIRTLRAREQRLRRIISNQEHIIKSLKYNIKTNNHKWEMRYNRAIEKQKVEDEPLIKAVKEIEKKAKTEVRKQLLQGLALKEQL